ncbi:MAG: EthD domain-containing protein [Acidimicrobiia bacterium]
MEKLVFLFGRKPPQTHAEFAEHYLEHHSLLGLRLAVQMDGYTVNLVPDEASGDFDLDAVTETWTPSVAAFMDPQQSFANEADMHELMTDDASFIANTRPYVVTEALVKGAWPDGPVRTRTPGVKRVSLHPAEATLPSTEGCTRVVRNDVVQSFLPDAPEAAVILLEWADSPDVLAPLAGVLNWLVEEHVQRQPTR